MTPKPSPKFSLKEVENKIQGLSDLPFVYDEAVYKIVELLLQKRTTNRILDYNAIPQSFLFYLTSKLKPDVAFANIENELLFSRVAFPEPTETITCYDGDQEELDNEQQDSYWVELEELKQPNYCKTSNAQWVELKKITEKKKFDVVFGVLAQQEYNFDNFENALHYLDADGIGVFHVPSAFFWYEDGADLVNLKNPGPFGDDREFYIQAALILPSTRSIQPLSPSFFWFTRDDEYLLIVGKEKRDDLFVGTITDNHSKNKELVENLELRRKGITMSGGFFTTMEYPSLYEQEFNDELPIWDWFISKTQVIHVRSSTFIKDLKFIESEESVTSTNSIIMKLPKSDSLGTGYIEIILDTTKISPSYFQFFLDSSQKSRDRRLVEIAKGTGINNIPSKYRFDVRTHLLSECSSALEVIHTILSTYVPLPDLSTQSEVEKLATEMRNVSSYIENLWNKLGRVPNEVQEIKTGFHSLSPEETMNAWINSLPFPLASILWAYHAAIDKKTKIDHLQHFFEALPQFFTTVLLSGLYTDSEFFHNNSEQWHKVDRKNTFRKASMGNWVKYGRNLARFVRTLNELDNEQLQKLFNKPSPNFINILTNEKLWKILEHEALPRRNEWFGHSGVVGEEELEKRIDYFENMLSRIRAIISDNLRNVKFILRKEEVRYHGGIREYRIQELLGPTQPFPEEQIKVLSEMESNQIYLLNRGDQHPLMLLPLVRILKGEKKGKEACYFYTSIKGKKCRFISYHYEDEAEILMDKSTVKIALDALKTEL